MTPEPTDQLDAATQVVVSGPEGELLDWRQIGWRRVEDQYAVASADLHGVKDGDLQRVRRLQRLMLRSRANTLLSVRRVTERNAGRRTAGVDANTRADRIRLDSAPWFDVGTGIGARGLLWQLADRKRSFLMSSAARASGARVGVVPSVWAPLGRGVAGAASSAGCRFRGG